MQPFRQARLRLDLLDGRPSQLADSQRSRKLSVVASGDLALGERKCEEPLADGARSRLREGRIRATTEQSNRNRREHGWGGPMGGAKQTSERAETGRAARLEERKQVSSVRRAQGKRHSSKSVVGNRSAQAVSTTGRAGWRCTTTRVHEVNGRTHYVPGATGPAKAKGDPQARTLWSGTWSLSKRRHHAMVAC